MDLNFSIYFFLPINFRILHYSADIFLYEICYLSKYEPRHEISNNVLCATSKGSDQPAHTRSLIRAFASRLNILSLNAPIATIAVCFSRLLKCLRSLYGKQCGPRSDCSGFKLFAPILNSSVMLGNYLQQTTSADDISDAFFFWRFKG